MSTAIFEALADPVRRDLILDLAEHGPRTATEISKGYPISRQGLLKHLGKLERARLVSVRKKGRGKFYFLTPEPLSEIDIWIKKIEAVWDKRLNRLKDLLENDAWK
ncbi:MAG TPA: metalloregulator ArsR/SmtB family transcription factor [Pyrinomonadaceae bacterium]|nr:metalloregulator ArsR/SmtB family transcription factor [Pyrinomonadaceae bacterium]HMP65444.1 metalloregulator ArsR/SmtB family transcription factor [Pyrinomonadaceae bacterium]